MFETVPRRFLGLADRLGARPMAYTWSRAGWVPLEWRAAGRLVRDFAAGLTALGHAPGDAVAIVSGTRWEWSLADLGTLAAGGVTVGVYPTMTAEQGRYVVEHSDARFVVVEDAAQLAKIEHVRAALPRVERIVVIDPAGARPAPDRIALADLLALGRGARADGQIEARIDALGSDAPATLIYTSGTTGPPKGAVITHGNIGAAMEMFSAVPIEPHDRGFLFLPLAHALQRIVNYRGLWAGSSGAFARSLDTVAEDLASARPTMVAAVPRIFEKVYARVHAQAASGPRLARAAFAWATGVGRDVVRLRQGGRPVPPLLAAQLAVARRLVFAKLRARLGGRVRLFVTGGAPIAREILEFFDAADVPILEGWGMTETCAAGTMNLPGAVRHGTIGRPLPGVDLRLDEDGELLIRGPNVFARYHKDPEGTRASFTAEGYFRTGDVGRRDADGYFTIVDRKKDLIITAQGKNIAPQNIENLLKTDARLSQAVVVGDARPYLVALLALDPSLASRPAAEREAIAREIVERRNAELATYERVRKFRLLPAELTGEAGELTPTLKVRRKVVAERYAGLIAEMYRA